MGKIKEILNNENGGPNLENIIAIAISLSIITLGLSVFKKSIISWIKGIQINEPKLLGTKMG